MALRPTRLVDHLALAVGLLGVSALQLLLPRPGWLGPALAALLGLQGAHWLWLAVRGRAAERAQQASGGVTPMDAFIDATLAVTAAVVVILHHEVRFAVAVGLTLAVVGICQAWSGLRRLRSVRAQRISPAGSGPGPRA